MEDVLALEDHGQQLRDDDGTTEEDTFCLYVNTVEVKDDEGATEDDRCTCQLSRLNMV